MKYEQTQNSNQENFDGQNNEIVHDPVPIEQSVRDSVSKGTILILSVIFLIVVLLVTAFWLFHTGEPKSSSQISDSTLEAGWVNKESATLREDEKISSLNLPPLDLEKAVSLSDFDILFRYETPESIGKFGLSVVTHFEGKPLYKVSYKEDERVSKYYLGTEYLFSTTDNVHAYNIDYEGELYILTSTLKDTTKNLYDYNGKRIYTYEESILSIERLENGELKITTGEREKKQPKIDIEVDDDNHFTFSITNGINCEGESYRPIDYSYDPEIDLEGTIGANLICNGTELNEDFVIVPQSLQTFITVDPLLWVGSKKTDVDDYYDRKVSIQNKMDEIMNKTNTLVAQFENDEIGEDDLIKEVYVLDAEYKQYEMELQSLDMPKQYVLVNDKVLSGPYQAAQELYLLDDKLFYTALTPEGWIAIYDGQQISDSYDSALGTDVRLDDGHLVFEMADLKGEFDMDRMKRGGSVDSRDIIVNGQLISQSTSREYTVSSRNFLMVGDTPAYIVENQADNTSYLVYGASEIRFPEQQIRQIYDSEGRLVVNTGESIYIEKN